MGDNVIVEYIATFLLSFLVTTIIGSVLYHVYQGIVLYIVCDRENWPNPWLVWIPMVTPYYLGWIASRADFNRIVIATLLPIVTIPAGSAVLLFTQNGIIAGILFLGPMLFSIISQYLINYHILRSNGLYFIMSFFIPFTFPYLVYRTYLRNEK